MENQWVKFRELVQQLQNVPPELRQRLLRLGNEADREDSPEVDCVFEPLPKTSLIDVGRWLEVLDLLRQAEESLQESKTRNSTNLAEIQDLRRDLEIGFKEALKAEQHSFNTAQWADLRSSEDDILAGLKEIEETGGLELHQFIGELEQVVRARERAAI